jgi:ubiquinone/menaquinone biosynthesis C-methylase UbiE
VALEMARRVGVSGLVMGIDVKEVKLQLARELEKEEHQEGSEPK